MSAQVTFALDGSPGLRHLSVMRPKIIALRQFYASRLGHQVKRRLRAYLLKSWPQHGDEIIVGVGYATPLLRVLERAGGKPAGVVALMPAPQGAIYWPVHSDNRSILADELRPPFARNSLHRVVMLHAFEYEPRPDELLKIFWELLAPGGRLLLIVPNRRGSWARSGTPFGHGTPYSFAQLRALLEEAKFTLREATSMLFAPPSRHIVWGRGFIDWLGGLVCPWLGGVLVVEAEKQIYAAITEKVAESNRVWAGAPIATP